MEEKKPAYTIPARFRQLENLHILFWLIKDLCWCLLFKPLGIFMILPTISVALFITWRNRRIFSELMHNLAISLWIVANSIWMIAEFYEADEQVKPYCVIPFSLGLALLLYYYIVYKMMLKKGKDVVVETEERLG